MRRSDLFKVVGITTGAYNNLAARDLLPFPPRTRSAQWGDYSVDDAFRLALMVKMGATCWDQLPATKVVRANYKLLKAAAKEEPANGRAWMFGSLWLVGDPEKPDALKRSALIALEGTVEDVVRSKVGQANARLSHWAVVNATEVLQGLQARASDHKVTSATLEGLVALLGGGR